MGAIYSIVNLKTGKTYIGSSSNIKQRLYRHRYDLCKGRHSNRYLQRAWNKYGQDAFEFKIVEDNIPSDKLLEREQYFIDNGIDLYNLSGIAGRIEQTAITRRKIGESQRKRLMDKEKHPMFGKHHSKKTKEKIRRAKTGSVHSPETRKKMSESHKGLKGCPRFGKANPNYNHIQYTFYHKTHGIFVGTRAEFVKEHRINRSTAGDLIAGRVKQTRSGWIIHNP